MSIAPVVAPLHAILAEDTTVIDGLAFTVTEIPLALSVVAVQLLAVFVTSTVYNPDVVTANDCDVTLGTKAPSLNHLKV